MNIDQLRGITPSVAESFADFLKDEDISKINFSVMPPYYQEDGLRVFPIMAEVDGKTAALGLGDTKVEEYEAMENHTGFKLPAGQS